MLRCRGRVIRVLVHNTLDYCHRPAPQERSAAGAQEARRYQHLMPCQVRLAPICHRCSTNCIYVEDGTRRAVSVRPGNIRPKICVLLVRRLYTDAKQQASSWSELSHSHLVRALLHIIPGTRTSIFRFHVSSFKNSYLVPGIIYDYV